MLVLRNKLSVHGIRPVCKECDKFVFPLCHPVAIQDSLEHQSDSKISELIKTQILGAHTSGDMGV